MPMVRAYIDKVVFPGQDTPVLTDVKLEVEQGEFVIVTGPVASGKSTLCHCLTGAIPHYFNARLEGQVDVCGRDLATVKLPGMADITGYVMQDPQNQFFSVSVREDVAFGPGNLGLPLTEVEKRVDEALEFVGLNGYEDRAPETLSGGEAQRAVLAGVLALKPKMLVLDHPAAELDAEGRKAIHARLGHLNRNEGITIIMVTEHPEEVEELATRFLVLEKGIIVSDSSCYLDNGLKGKFSESLLSTPANKFTCSEKQEAAESSDNQAREKTVELINCSYTYPGGQQGCLDVNLQLYRGELTALMGLNGSGKTTLSKHLNGLLWPQTGEVRILGRGLDSKNRNQIMSQVGFLFQNPDFQIFAETIEAEVAFGLKIRGYSEEEIGYRVDNILAEMGLLEYKGVHPHRLSRSQRQLLALGSVMVCKPAVLIADEPTAGLHKSTAIKIMEQLAALAAAGGTVLLITHDLQLAASHAQRLIAMHRNRIQLDIPMEILRSHVEDLAEIGLDFEELITAKAS